MLFILPTEQSRSGKMLTV